jgi:hypothetical protein
MIGYEYPGTLNCVQDFLAFYEVLEPQEFLHAEELDHSYDELEVFVASLQTNDRIGDDQQRYDNNNNKISDVFYGVFNSGRKTTANV